MWKTKGDDIQYDKDTVLELNPECRDVLYGCPVIVIRLVCLSYPWHKLGFSWQKVSIIPVARTSW